MTAAGVKVRFGTDNVRDWFFPFGDGDMLETALFATVAAGVENDADPPAGLCDGRAALMPAEPRIGRWCQRPMEDALARRQAGRIVSKGGRQVAGPVL